MDKKFLRTLQPGHLPIFAALLLFCIPGFVLNPWLGLGQTAIVVTLYAIDRRFDKKRRRDLMRYMDSLTLQFDTASQNAVFHIPLPMAVVRMQNAEIIWCNSQFSALDEKREFWFSTLLSDLAPDMSLEWLEAGDTSAPQSVMLGGHEYKVSGCVVSEEDSIGTDELAALFFTDITMEGQLRRDLADSELICALIRIDNFEEIAKHLSGNERTLFLADVDTRVTHWAESSQGIFLKTDRENYILLCEKRYLEELSKFEVLTAVREAEGAGPIPATLSIGVGLGGTSPADTLGFARLAMDMALSRGGDQAVIKDAASYSFFGGRSREVEQRTKVRARVIANAVRDMIETSPAVLIMGHHFSDMDAIGAAVGVFCACRNLGKPAHIVIDLPSTAAYPLYERMREIPEYRSTFVSVEEAEAMVSPETLLIVCDVNRAGFVEAPNLLGVAERVVVIDHHRRVADFIENPAVSLHEPYASSTCELVSELLQYLVSHTDLLRAEAESLLAGIMLDTKNFTMKTGVRTFEAAAFLRRAGADTIAVRRLFANTMEANVALCDIMRTATRYHDNMAIAISDTNTDRAIAGQAADDLLNVAGVQASFVIFVANGVTQISARSLGQVNVQLVMEKLGGGGSLNSAGAQLPGKSVSEVADMLRGAVESYFTLT